MSVAVVLLLAFTAGALPFSAWIARAYRVDLRQHGSGNIGATNVYRTLGWKPGIAALALDILKGAVAIIVARTWMPDAGGVHALAGGAAVMGHIWSPFIGFRGGKGVATSLGIFLALAPWPGFLAAGVWVAVILLCGWISLASGIAAVFLPLAVFLSKGDLGPRFPWLFGISLALAILVVLRHRSNWIRILEGSEAPIWRKSAAEKTSPEENLE